MISTSHSTSSDEIPDQISGYWLAPRAEIPPVSPTYRPTGAVLPRPGSEEHEFTCLDLVSVEYTWMPLSEAGRYTYAHSEGLLRDEPWRFVAWRGDERMVFEAHYDSSLEPETVSEVYGEEAARRRRPDRPAVQLRLRRLSAES